MRILLADAQPHIRSALQFLLKYEQDVFVVGEASDAKSLLAQIDATQPDAILLDWELPGLGAMGSLDALRVDYPHLLVIVLSGRPESHQEILAAGADALVYKVDPPERLLDTLETINLKHKIKKSITGNQMERGKLNYQCVEPVQKRKGISA